MNLPVFCLLLLGGFVVHAQHQYPDYEQTPDSLGMTYREVLLLTSDSASIATWIIPTTAVRKAKTTLVFAIAGGNISNVLQYAKAFTGAGFDVVLFDYRGRGHSSGFTRDPMMVYYNEYVTDLVTTLRASRQSFPANRLGIIGFSMGTIVATLAARQTPIDFLVMDGYVTNPTGLVQRWKQINGSVFRLPTGAEAYPAAVRSVACPILIFAGTNDDITTVADARLAARQRPNRQLIVYKGGHIQATQAFTQTTFCDGLITRIQQFSGAQTATPGRAAVR